MLLSSPWGGGNGDVLPQRHRSALSLTIHRCGRAIAIHPSSATIRDSNRDHDAFRDARVAAGFSAGRGCTWCSILGDRAALPSNADQRRRSTFLKTPIT